MATVPLVEKLFGDQNKKKLKPLYKDVEKINALEPEIQKLSDEELQAKTAYFKEQLANGKTLTDIQHEAFAVVREAARRTLGQRHYDVQLLGGLVLHSGAVAEMRTGEGKTLSATSAVYLNALEGKGVHIVTVNDYLARRDADWMGQVYHFLGLTVSCIQNGGGSFIYDADLEAVTRRDLDDDPTNDTTPEESSTEGEGYEALIAADMTHLRAVKRQEAYAADVTFGTNNEFGFDYLRDNMVRDKRDRVQRGLHYAVIDEVDSILIDEARTPLIISAPAQQATDQYHQFSKLVAALKEHDHYTVDEKMRAVNLTDEGIASIEKTLGVDNLYVEGGLRTVHHIEQALKAQCLFTRDKDYVVKEGEVVIIDEFTGRMMEGRRYSEGLHQAIEAKEGLQIKQESRTLATITLQNLFRMYNKLGGMTGTAETETEEFYKIYELDVVVIPTHREIARQDATDRVYKNRQGKFEAVIKEVKRLHENGQPVLIGTISIEQNELFSTLLKKAGVPHQVLNAKQHEQEAEIIAQAGKRGAVTVATNMAGRGVDIILGGNPVDIEEQRAVKELGGLAVIGTERHESRRIDNQLRGRAGRQGDPGYSQFFVSTEDDLMRVFGSDRIHGMMERLGVPDDMPIENKMVTKSLESAQKKVEARNFDIRKHLVDYDNVVNKHRDAIYRQRNRILDMEAAELREYILELVQMEIEQVVSMHTNMVDEDDGEEWNIAQLCESMSTVISMTPDQCTTDIDGIRSPKDGQDKLGDAEARTAIIDYFADMARDQYQEMANSMEPQDAIAELERSFALRAIDMLWVEHLDQMSFLRDSIGLRGYGQRDPLVEYKRESYGMFQSLLASIQQQIVHNVFKIGNVEVHTHKHTDDHDHDHDGHSHDDELEVRYTAPQKGSAEASEQKAAPAIATDTDPEGNKIGRNDPCYCGSGKKYKKCHGAR